MNAESTVPARVEVSAPAARCDRCRYFDQAASHIEAQLGALTSMGSGYSSVRADDGLCQLHDRYLAAACHCRAYEPRALEPS